MGAFNKLFFNSYSFLKPHQSSFSPFSLTDDAAIFVNTNNYANRGNSEYLKKTQTVDLSNNLGGIAGAAAPLGKTASDST